MAADLRETQENQGVSENRIDKLGFYIAEFYNQYHKDPHQNEVSAGGMPEESEYDFFRFEKTMK